eukprot:Opistho-2@52926
MASIRAICAFAVLALCVAPLNAAPVEFKQKYSAISCDVCTYALGKIQGLIKDHSPMSLINTVATDVCITFKIEDKNVCSLVIPEFTHEVVTVFEDVVLSPAEICGIVHLCAKDPSPLAKWNITLPSTPKPPLNPRTPPTPGSPVRRILHLSDTHHDPLYTVGLNTQCGEPLCCRPPNGPGTGATSAGKWGDYNCDTPLALLENALETASKMTPPIDYIFWTGDVPAHNVWNQSRDDQLAAIQSSTDILLKYFPNTRVFPSLGNHEGAPVNSFPPPYITGDDSDDWLLDGLVKSWSSWLPTDTISTIKQGGFYTTLIEDGLRLISLNMNYCNNQNWWILINQTDPAGELQWLINTLQAAEDKGELVYIIGHIPPGSGACVDDWSFNYNIIVDRYESTILSQFFGHEHDDEFELSYDVATNSRPTSMYFAAPSITPYTNMNPGFRMYLADGGKTKLILDSLTYITDLVDANARDEPLWILEYSALDAYGMKGMQPADWHDFAVRMASDDVLFGKYFNHYYKSNLGGRTCDANCKKSMICDARASKNTPCFLGGTKEEHQRWMDAQPKSC